MSFRLFPYNRSHLVHLLGERFVHNVGVVECHSGIRMTEHLRYILQFYIIRQRDCCGKCIAGGMHCKVLFNAAKVSNLLQIRIHLLIGVHRKDRFICPTHRVVAILFNQLQRILQQRHKELNFGLLALFVNPLATVCIFRNMLGLQIIDIDKRQACITAKDKDIPHHIKPFDAELLGANGIHLLNRKKILYNLLLRELDTCERIDRYPTIGNCEIYHLFQALHISNHRVLSHTLLNLQKSLKITNHLTVEVLDWNVRHFGLAGHHLLEITQTESVTAQCNRIELDAHQLRHSLVMLFKSGVKHLLADMLALQILLDSQRISITIALNQLFVNLVCSCSQRFEMAVNLNRDRAFAYGSLFFCCPTGLQAPCAACSSL